MHKTPAIVPELDVDEELPALILLGDLGWGPVDVALLEEVPDLPHQSEEPTIDEEVNTNSAFVYSNAGIPWQRQLAEEQDPNNPYFPFANEAKWEFAAWVNCTGLSHNELDGYFHLQCVHHFNSSRMLLY
jgi:hypothetical protein